MTSPAPLTEAERLAAEAIAAARQSLSRLTSEETREWVAIPADDATEEWGVLVAETGDVAHFVLGRDAAEEFVRSLTLAATATVVHRYVGPWEPVDLDEEGR